MSQEFHTTRRVEWVDTDAAGIIHFTAFFRYMEAAEHELLRAHGLTVKVRNAEQMMSWPRVSARCEFRSIVRFEDVLDIKVKIARMGEKSITYQYDFSHEGRAVADGEITVVCCQMMADGPPNSVRVPSWFTERLQTEPEG